MHLFRNLCPCLIWILIPQEILSAQVPGDAGTPPKILHPRWPYAHLPQEVTESVLPLFQVFRRKPQELQGHSIAQLVQYRPEQLETSNIHSYSARFLSLGLPYH